uniref:D-isomer specific 2-hydroxyacid dehydrogenase NAD-binding n=1 Tax=Cyanothece sp. (strain PCC 7425 / ATCC 29141) TaxID=395961 RepID=B8HK82_CYAP4
MKVAVFSTKSYDQQFLATANGQFGHDLHFFEPRLTRDTASLARGFEAVCVFVNDELDRSVLEMLAAGGVRAIALRCAGFDRVDLKAAEELDIAVVRVPAYSPYGVAEHTVGMILALNRKLHRAYNRIREGNFSLEGLLGFELRTKTVGIIGTGKIGQITGEILFGFGCEVLAYDPYPNAAFASRGAIYVDLPELLSRSDIISLHCPLTPQTYHLIDERAIAAMKPGVMLVNTSRGALIDTRAVIEGLKSKQIGALALDVYEEEADLFFEDLSYEIIQDDVFQRLLTFPNVLITGHQAFFTETALTNIAETTLANLREIDLGKPCANQVNRQQLTAPSPARVSQSSQ